jgi:hypothetical protein
MVNIRKTFTLNRDKCIIKHNAQRTDTEIIYLKKLAEINKDYDIRYEFKSQLPRGIKRALEIFIQSDVLSFCGEQKARDTNKVKREITNKKYSNRIIPVTKIEDIKPERILTPGKKGFVPTCSNEANWDPGKGCPASTLLGENPRVERGFAKDIWGFRFGDCRYPCYSSRDHQNPFKTIYKVSESRLEQELLGEARLIHGSDKTLNRFVKNIRIGKRVDGNFWMAEQFFGFNPLIAFLETCIKVNTDHGANIRCAYPSKFTPFRKDIAEVLRKTNSVLLVDYGWDNMEPGAVLYSNTIAMNNEGNKQKDRLERALQFQAADVNTAIYLHIIAHKPIGKREREVLDFAHKNNLLIQLLPIKFTDENPLIELTGQKRDFLLYNPQEVFNFAQHPERGSYIRIGKSKQLLAKKIHPDWLKLIGNNSGQIRMCHHNDKDTYCGDCFLGPGSITPTIHVEKKFSGSRKRRKSDKSKTEQKKNENDGQFSFS